jgi:hypothetical protein
MYLGYLLLQLEYHSHLVHHDYPNGQPVFSIWVFASDLFIGHIGNKVLSVYLLVSINLVSKHKNYFLPLS